MKILDTRQVDERLPVAVKDGRVILVDQRHLPGRLEYFDATNLDDMIVAIKDMVVRGAPSIGVAAALGLAFEARRLAAENPASFRTGLSSARDRLQNSRPTAVNLRWGTDEIYALYDSGQKDSGQKDSESDVSACASRMVERAERMIAEHLEINRTLSDLGAELVPANAGILTHCNAGALAACGWGTALGVIRSAVEQGKRPRDVYVDETRPRQQGARLTVWELQQDGLDPTLITDNMAGYLMALKRVDLVIVGADRITTSGDVANKIGTYSLAVLAHAHGVPFYVAAPVSTIDPHLETGADIPIEERHGDEVLKLDDRLMAPSGTRVFNPSFDVTPARLVSAIVTERGVLRAPYGQSIKSALPGST